MLQCRPVCSSCAANCSKTGLSPRIREVNRFRMGGATAGSRATAGSQPAEKWMRLMPVLLGYAGRADGAILFQVLFLAEFVEYLRSRGRDQDSESE